MKTAVVAAPVIEGAAEGVIDDHEAPTRIPSISRSGDDEALPCLIKNAVIPAAAASTPVALVITGATSEVPKTGLIHKLATSSVVDEVLYV